MSPATSHIQVGYVLITVHPEAGLALLEGMPGVERRFCEGSARHWLAGRRVASAYYQSFVNPGSYL